MIWGKKRMDQIEELLKNARIVEITYITVKYLKQNLVKNFQICIDN